MSHTPIGDIPRYLAKSITDLPYMTIIVLRGTNGLYYAWQPEFNITEERMKTMDEAILSVATVMGELITSEEFDYLQSDQDEIGYYVPIPLLPEDLAKDKPSLMEMLTAIFPSDEFPESPHIFFASMPPMIR